MTNKDRNPIKIVGKANPIKKVTQRTLFDIEPKEIKVAKDNVNNNEVSHVIPKRKRIKLINSTRRTPNRKKLKIDMIIDDIEDNKMQKSLAKNGLRQDSIFDGVTTFSEKIKETNELSKYKMPQEDKDKFIKLSDETKLGVMEVLLDTVENNKKIKSQMDKMMKDMQSFRSQIATLTISNNQQIKEKIVVDKNKKWTIDDSAFIELYTISSKLKDILTEERMSQTEICEHTGINKSTMSNILSYPEKITLLNAYKISKVLGKSIEEIFDFDMQMEDYVE